MFNVDVLYVGCNNFSVKTAYQQFAINATIMQEARDVERRTDKRDIKSRQAKPQDTILSLARWTRGGWTSTITTEIRYDIENWARTKKRVLWNGYSEAISAAGWCLRQQHQRDLRDEANFKHRGERWGDAATQHKRATGHHHHCHCVFVVVRPLPPPPPPLSYSFSCPPLPMLLVFIIISCFARGRSAVSLFNLIPIYLDVLPLLTFCNYSYVCRRVTAATRSRRRSPNFIATRHT